MRPSSQRWCEASLLGISPSSLEDPHPFSPHTLSTQREEETELAWVIGIIIISAFSASWVPEKVREQHEDGLISVLVLASIWQQTIGKGLGPGNSSMAQDCPHRQNTTAHHKPRWVSETASQAAWPSDWLLSSGLAIEDSGEVEEGGKWRE